MKILKIIFIFLMILIVSGALYLGTLDGKYDVSRSRSINADPVVVYNDLNDYKNWKDWGPWFEEDSTLAVQYESNTTGEEAGDSWASDQDGGGRMRTLKTDPPNRLDQEIFFNTPFGEMRSSVYWIIEKSETGTNLTWGIKGEMPFLTRFMASNMESQIGPMQERGLELFDENIQRKLRIFSVDHLGVVDYSGGFYLYLSTSTKISEIEIKSQEMIRKIEEYVENNSIRVTGSPFVLYHKFDEENGTSMFSVAYPIAERIITEKGSDLLTGYMERGKYSKSVLKGSYENSAAAWQEAYGAAEDLRGYTILHTGEPFEVFVNSPDNTPNPAELITEIYIPVQPRIRKGE